MTHNSTEIPTQLEAEQKMLGILLASGSDPSDVMTSLRAEHFADPIHGSIFSAIASRLAAGRRVDVHVIAEDVADDLAEIGGKPYLTQLVMADLPTEGRAVAEEIRDAWLRRCLIDAGEHLCVLAAETTQGAFYGPGSPPATEQAGYLTARLSGLLAMLRDAT